VLFNGKAGKNISISADGQSLTVDAPAGATTGLITVTNPGGSIKSASPFTVDPQPSITSLSKTSGAVDDTIQINGKNLIGITGVKFGTDDPVSPSSTAGAPSFIQVAVPASAVAGKLTLIGTNGTATSAWRSCR
jgi:hypothetical protein